MKNQKKLIGICISVVLMLSLSACNIVTFETRENTDLYDYDVEERIAELGLELRIPGVPVANYSGIGSPNQFLAGVSPVDDRVFCQLRFAGQVGGGGPAGHFAETGEFPCLIGPCNSGCRKGF